MTQLEEERMLQLSDVYKRFDTVVALDGASVAIAPGTVRALLGGNGSGKSTLAKVITGAVEPDRASYVLDGKNVDVRGPRDAMRLGVAATYQETSLLPHLSVEENLALSIAVLGNGRGSTSRAHDVQAVLERLGIGALSSLKVRELSLGSRYLVELAKALLIRPRYLILDELTSALRRQQVEVVKSIVGELAAEGVGILFISHRLEEVYEICRFVTVLRNGKVVLEGDLGQLTSSDLMAAMAGTVLEEYGPEALPLSTGPSGSPPLLQVENLPVPVFGGSVSLKGWPGEIVGIAGLQGQGQSELLRVLFGAWPGLEVRVTLAGNEVVLRSIGDAVKHGFAFISGDREGEMIFPSRSIWENLQVVTWASKGGDRGNLHEVVELLGLKDHRPSTIANRLSGGNQQKLAVGRWMMTRSRILLADDPTRGVDVRTRREIHSFLRRMASEGALVLFASSQDSELADLCNRVYVMYRGRIVSELQGDKISEHDIALASMQTAVEA